MGLVKSYTHTDWLFVPLTEQQQRIRAWHRYWTPARLEQVRRLIGRTRGGHSQYSQAHPCGVGSPNELSQPAYLPRERHTLYHASDLLTRTGLSLLLAGKARSRYGYWSTP